jgi:putative Mg2+ transporter-C (MgtC) family protein
MLQILPEDILKLLLALALGGVIGAEREFRDKAAGFRTLMFICAGSALFTIFSTRLAEDGGGDTTRIAAQIVSGIGFLGAGVILRENGEIRGLTTAATVWLVAALGVGVGGGEYVFSTLATLLLLAALMIFPYLEMMMGRMRQVQTYQITIPIDHQKHDALCKAFQEQGLHVIFAKRTRRGDEMICSWTAAGNQAAHEKMVRLLLDDPEIKAFDL